MKSMRRARRAFTVERLEDRVVMAVAGYIQGFVFSAPGTLLNIPGTYNPSPTIQYSVRFITRAGDIHSEVPVSVTANGVVAAVPLILNPTTLTPINQGVHVVVFQQGTQTGTNAIYHLQSTPKPSGVRPPGLASEVALVRSIQTLATAEIAYAQIAAANPSATAAASLAFDTDALRVQAVSLLATIDPLVRGTVTSIAAGTVPGVGLLPLTLNRGTLSLLDSTLVQASKAPSTPFTLQPDLVTTVTEGAVGQTDQASQNGTAFAPGQLAGANTINGYAALGQTIAQISLVAGAESQVATSVTAAIANPANQAANVAAAGAAVNALNSSASALAFNTQFFAYENTIFSPAYNALATAGGDIGTDLSSLAFQLFGVTV
jgi:hypothetical protein